MCFFALLIGYFIPPKACEKVESILIVQTFYNLIFNNIK